MAPLCNEEGHAAFYSGEGESSTTISSNRSPLTSFSTEGESLPFAMKPLGRRSVSFSPLSSVHVDAVMNIDDYSAAEKYECWYQVDEMRMIRAEVKETVALMNQNVPMNKTSSIFAEMNDAFKNLTKLTTHGLEGKTKVGKRHRKEIRLASLTAVFDEQTLQEIDGVCDPIMIARAYSEYSYHMQVAAFQRAVFYQKEATAIYRMIAEESDIQSSLDKASTSVDTSSSDVAEATAEPTKSDFNEFRSTLEGEKTEQKTAQDVLESTSSPTSNIMAASSELAADTTNNKIDENDAKETLRDDGCVRHPYYVGPLSIRDRFAYNTRSLMGAFRVGQI